MFANNAYLGKYVAISGATGGIGLEHAARYASLASQLVLIDRDAKALETLAQALPGSVTLVCDQTDPTQIAATCASAGVVDVFINNAGIIVRKPLLEHTEADIDSILDTNLGGAVRMALGFARQMQVPVGRGGVILNLATQHAFAGGAGRAIYATSKAGIVQFTKAAAVEFAPLGIRVLAIAPGPIANDMTAGPRNDAAYQSAVTDRMPIGRFLESGEVADVIVSLCHESMSAIVGATLLADGGGVLS